MNGVPGNSHRRFSSLAEAVTAYNNAVAANAVHRVNMDVPAMDATPIP